MIAVGPQQKNNISYAIYGLLRPIVLAYNCTQTRTRPKLTESQTNLNDFTIRLVSDA